MIILSLLNTKNVKNWSGSPINTFGDDKESNRQECLFYTEKKDEEIPQSVCENTALRNDYFYCL